MKNKAEDTNFTLLGSLIIQKNSTSKKNNGGYRLLCFQLNLNVRH